jgi:ADP-ribosylglycohydrolase
MKIVDDFVWHGLHASTSLREMKISSNDHTTRLARARIALEGLSVGDAFGQRFFGDVSTMIQMISLRATPRGPWHYTDDTEMALSVYNVLEAHQHVDRDALAQAFADRYVAEPTRGYGGTAHGILASIAQGVMWSYAAARVFDGTGSMGNGAAMRVAPAAAYYADDLDAALRAAEYSAAPTHAHPEGVAGAVATAAACFYAWHATRDDAFAREHPSLIEFVWKHTSPGATRDGIAQAMNLGREATVAFAAGVLGTGDMVTSPDTVPFCVWCADRYLASYEEALWNTVEGLGDRDTTCAIVGGIVALAHNAEIPPDWLKQRETLCFTLNKPTELQRQTRADGIEIKTLIPASAVCVGCALVGAEHKPFPIIDTHAVGATVTFGLTRTAAISTRKVGDTQQRTAHRIGNTRASQ